MTKIHRLSTPLSQYLFKLNIAFPPQGFLAADEYQFEYVDYVHLLCPFPGCCIARLCEDSSSYLTVSYPKGCLCLLVRREWREEPVITV